MKNVLNDYKYSDSKMIQLWLFLSMLCKLKKKYIFKTLNDGVILIPYLILRFGINHIYINFIINIWKVLGLTKPKSWYINTLKQTTF